MYCSKPGRLTSLLWKWLKPAPTMVSGEVKTRSFQKTWKPQNYSFRVFSTSEFTNSPYTKIEKTDSIAPQGVLPNKEVGGLGPHIKFGGKIWAKVRSSSPSKRKNLGSSVTTRRKSWGKVPFLGSYLKFRGQNLGYLSLIFSEAKFGAPTRISEANFGAKPLDLLIWKYPLGIALSMDAF